MSTVLDVAIAPNGEIFAVDDTQLFRINPTTGDREALLTGDEPLLRSLDGQVAVVPFPEPLVLDFNNDSNVDVLDIDSLVGEIVAGTNGGLFDLTGEGKVDDADLTHWLSGAATHNGFDQRYSAGDSNLDGSVNSNDFNSLGLNWNRGVALWSGGDFTADGRVDANDLNALGINWQYSIPLAPAAAAPVPEPSGMMMIIVLAGLASDWRTTK